MKPNQSTPAENINKKRITLSTLKQFLRKNEGRLLIRELSTFSWMTNCIKEIPDEGFTPLLKTDAPNTHKNNLGYSGIWVVGSSRNWFDHYQSSDFIGIETSNCCGRFIVAIKKHNGEVA